jgi:hypothetical protein
MVSASHRRVNARNVGVVVVLTTFVLLVTPAAATDSKVDEVTVRGLRHTKQDEGLVARAIERANVVLSTSGVRLVPAWAQSPASKGDNGDVPVYLIAARASADSTPAAVPSGCRCVFVNPAFLAAWVAFNSKGTGRLPLDRGYFLTFVLLHEAGHIKDGTPAAAFKDGELSQLNIDPSKAKVNERHADEFAAELLRKLSRSTPANSASIEANFVVMELSKLSWNMQAFRTLDEFGSFAVGKPSVYFDDGYMHPNMALRVLRTNDLIQQTAETRKLLEAFEEARQRGANPQPLYQRKP